MAASTVTGNTSVVLVSAPQTIVYLSSVGYPGHIVTIQDIGGVASQGSPIVVSTTKNVFFADGSISTLLFQPNGFVTASSKTPTVWQLLNNVGFLTSLSNAYVSQLTVGNGFITTLSSSQEYVSSSVIGRVNVTKSLNLLGDVVILGDITVAGEVDLFSTLDVRQDINLSSGLTVLGNVAMASSLFVQDTLTVNGVLSTLQDLVVGENLSVSSFLVANQLLVPPNISVQSLKMDSINVLGGLQTANGISVGQNLVLNSVNSGFTTTSSVTVLSSIQVGGLTSITGNVDLRGDLNADSLESMSSGRIGRELFAWGVLTRGTLSSGNSLYVGESLIAEYQTNVSSALVTGSVTTNSLIVKGNAEISSLSLQGDLRVSGGSTMMFSSLLTSSLQVASMTVRRPILIEGLTSVSSKVSTIGDFAIGSNLQVFSGFQMEGAVSVSSGVSTLGLLNYGTTSTNAFYEGNNLVITGAFTLSGSANVGILGAPIQIILSTLTLSNTLTVKTSSHIPEFEATSTLFNTFPKAIGVGTSQKIGTYDTYININSTANIRATLKDTNTGILADGKAISSLRVSTLLNTDVLSSFVIGSNTFSYPTIPIPSLLFLGSSNYKTSYPTIGSLTGITAPTGVSPWFSAAYSQDTQTWVAVGQVSAFGSDRTIQYSTDYGATWKNTSGAQFGNQVFEKVGYDVVYMQSTFQNVYQPVWVAGGQGSNADNALNYSYDGITWSAGGGVIFGGSVYVRRLLYYPRSGSGQGAVLIGGGYTATATFGIGYSEDGVNWTGATNAAGLGLLCYDLTIGPNNSILAAGYDPTFPNVGRIFLALSNSYDTGWSALPSVPLSGNSIYFKTIAYGNGYYVVGGEITSGGQPSLTAQVYRSQNLSTWTGVAGLLNYYGPQRIIFDSNIGKFLAIGWNQTFFPNYVYISPDGFQTIQVVELPNSSGGLSMYNIVSGSYSGEDLLSKYFTANVESRFQTAVSTLSFYGSTIRASSIQASTFVGTTAGLSNVLSFSATMGISTLSTQYFAINSTFEYFYSTLASTLVVSSAITSLSPSIFPSTVSLWVGAGLDSRPNGNIQQTTSLTGWTISSNANFDGYGTAVYGNKEAFFSQFIATGADSDSNNTVLVSQNGYEWSPIQNGPLFTVKDSNDYYRATCVTYGTWISTIGFLQIPYKRWVVGGYNPGTGSTIFYSDDGSNFYPGVSAYGGSVFGDYIKDVRIGGNVFLALTSYSQMIRSTNGKDWLPIMTTFNPPVGLDAGLTGNGGGFDYGITNPYTYNWLAMDYQQNLWSSTDGNTFTNLGQVAGIQPAGKLFFADTFDYQGYWIAQGCNFMYLTSTVLTITYPNAWCNVGPGAFSGAALTQWNTLFYNSNTQVWFAGGTAENLSNTLWVSSNSPPNRAAGKHWLPISKGGFSTGIEFIGAGYASMPIRYDSFGSESFLVGGTGSFTGRSAQQPNILQLTFGMFTSNTSTILSQANASNVFDTTVYGLALTSSPTFEYQYIAVGDGETPQKTIARSVDKETWVPAITGGFSPAGYGAIYYSTADIFLAVGKAAASTATIQYSSDGANWHATNKSGSLPFGGRGITKFRDESGYPNRLVAVGEGILGDYNFFNSTRTVAYSDNGFTWTDYGGFNVTSAAYGVGAGLITSPIFGSFWGVIVAAKALSNYCNVACNAPSRSLQYSPDGLYWYDSLSGGFEVAAYGVAYGEFAFNSNIWVAVGENSNPGGATIKYSYNGVNWSNVTNCNFYFAGYGVSFKKSGGYGGFCAVGKGLSNNTTVLTSSDGVNWYNVGFGGTNSNGFRSQVFFGAANGLFSQQTQSLEQNAFIDMPKFVAYNRSNATIYGAPTMRFTSTSITFNEAATVNLSSQLMINTYLPVGSNTVTVEGSIRTSTLVYTNSEPISQNVNVSSLIVSTFQFTDVMLGQGIQTPSLGIGPSNATLYSLPNYMGGCNDNGPIYRINLNDTIYARGWDFYGGIAPGFIGINTNKPTVHVDVSGTVACSTLSTYVYKQSSIALTIPNSEYIQNSNLIIFEGPNSRKYANTNTIYSEASSISFNTILSVNLSTQKVGYFTSNPLFGFDARKAGWFSTLRTADVNAGMFFLTLQSA